MDCTASVIIPVYNAEKDIVRCVESIIYGIYKDIEVILVEDCSKDDSWNICRKLAEQFENVFCYQNEKNSGVSFTRNRGLKEAHGKYILFVDSDDWVSGRYAETLIHAAEENEDSLVICGCHFHENVAGYKRDYIWEENGQEEYLIPKDGFFELPKRFHLQQLWNKIFHRDIIELHQIRFDVAQSMGEDYQFVLDYMEAARTQQCVVLNEPLYYYVRANTTSLMSKFGLTETENEYKRLKQLLKLSGEDNLRNQKCHDEAVWNSKMNSVYQAVHSNIFSKKEKIFFIEQIMQDGEAEKYYREQSAIKRKEKLVTQYHKIENLQSRVSGRIQREKNKHMIAKMRKTLKVTDFSVISQNCIGGVFYHDMGMNFLSPTINLFFKGSDFVKFVQRLEYYMGLELHMTWGEEYPIGYLDDIAIYFMHYCTCEEAKRKWDERKQRIKWDRIIILCTDMEDFDEDTYQGWKKITYPKILFSAKQRNDESVIFYPEYGEQDHVLDLIPKRKFYQNSFLINIVNKVYDTAE